MLGERHADLRLGHDALHEAAPQRLPAAGPPGLLVDVALALQCAEQPRADVDGAGRHGICHRGAQVVIPGVDGALAGAAGRLVPLDVDPVFLEVLGWPQAQQVAARHAGQHLDPDIGLGRPHASLLPARLQR
ncbi:hypothetical protein D3C81_1164310 [compost metagenome]